MREIFNSCSIVVLFSRNGSLQRELHFSLGIALYNESFARMDTIAFTASTICAPAMFFYSIHTCGVLAGYGHFGVRASCAWRTCRHSYDFTTVAYGCAFVEQKGQHPSALCARRT